MDLALIVVIVGTIALLAWTAVRLDARGEYLQTVIATRQAGCECGTPTAP